MENNIKMSGKSYTMREMKTIVEYLVEHKLYGEIRGRKMWIDFANSQLTQRTWQSLKETFLKRILPDIHNPYYKLTIEQINSFRSGYDVVDRNKSKLEIHTISDDSNSNENNPKDIEPSKNGNSNEAETTAGENIKCSKIPSRSRSSADTVILDNCYQNAEEIQKELESNGDTENDDKPHTTSKSLRDCITYSEPLTPMLQEVLDDFASEPEDSDRENQMEIVDTVPETDNSEDTNQIHNETKNDNPNIKSVATDVAKNAKGLSAEVVEEVLAQELDSSSKNENKSPAKKTQDSTNKATEIPDVTLDNISSVLVEKDTERSNDANMETSETIISFTAETSATNDSKNSEINNKNQTHQTEPTVSSGTLNNSNVTVDASLPNNPEALKNKQSIINGDVPKDISDGPKQTTSNKGKILMKAARLRSNSEDGMIVKSAKKNDQLHKKITAGSIPNKKSENVELKSAINNQPKMKDIKLTKKQLVEKNTVKQDKPSTSFDQNTVDEILLSSEKNSSKNDSHETKNPCLQNVNLFDEQFNKMKYNMSESSDTEQNKKETNGKKQEAKVPKGSNDVVMLRSHTESETEEIYSPPRKKSRAGVLSSKSERDKAISNMFGFTSGGVGSKRRRQLSRRRRTISQNNVPHHTLVSNSSEWTSESDGEAFISPPRSRKNRPTRKYLKPQSTKVLSLEEEGGLFVLYGKKIFPLVKDGKIIKNYVTYLPESESDEGESFWKQKYVEEKKKAEELKKLLKEAKEPSRSKGSESPILQANPQRTSKSTHNPPRESSNEPGKEICLPALEDKKEEPKMEPPEKIKIKFTKNDEEVHLEGHWPQIHTVFEQVVQIFHKKPQPVCETKPNMIVEPPDHPKELSSGLSTPIIITAAEDPEVHEKVNEMESKIFKEIEERDREEESEPKEQETNVTKRKVGRPRKSSSSASLSPAKKPKLSKEAKTKESTENTTASKQDTTQEAENNVTEKKDDAPKRSSRTPRKVLNETVNTNESKTIQTRRNKQKLDASHGDEEEVRYMFPPKNKRLSTKSPANIKTNQKPQKSSAKLPKIFTSPDNFSLNSMDSTQGYQDSDVSPVKAELRKKKKVNMSTFMIKTRNSLRRSTRRRSHPYLYCDAYNDSSNSSVDASVQKAANENSSLNTEAYRSESYQLLMPLAKKTLRRLEPIDETSPIGNDTVAVKSLDSLCRNEISAEMNNIGNYNSDQLTSDIGSSSNVSLPMSPELSVVENMSISKDMINTIEDYPTLNEMQGNELKEIPSCSKYMISDVDVSVPLMQQHCELETCDAVISDATAIDPKNVVTESLLSKIGTFNISDKITGTDTLDKKLHDLLLDSAKKMTRTEGTSNKESLMDIDVTASRPVEARKEKEEKKAKSKKRCSTPRKRKTSTKSAVPKVDPVVEEEHIESYSHSGRKSCPPLFQTFTCDDNAMNEQLNITNLSITEKRKEKPKGRKKKDIIRVKILRPKIKKSQEKLRTESIQNESTMSVTDSGINNTESGVFFPVDDSVDLIHNHSETCLYANECVGDSIEFVDNSKSVITLGDSMQSGDNLWSSQTEYNDAENLSPDIFCNNAQDMKSFYNKKNNDNTETTSETVYHSPLGTEASINSLITEDLSDDLLEPPTRPTKWYLLSEDETTNTNLVGQSSPMLNAGNVGSRLKQLFPITCAVPDLSTITEMSKENEDSRKPTSDLDNITGDDINSHSIFDSNF